MPAPKPQLHAVDVARSRPPRCSRWHHSRHEATPCPPPTPPPATGAISRRRPRSTRWCATTSRRCTARSPTARSPYASRKTPGRSWRHTSTVACSAGFARLRCDGCRESVLVAFSAKDEASARRVAAGDRAQQRLPELHAGQLAVPARAGSDGREPRRAITTAGSWSEPGLFYLRALVLPSADLRPQPMRGSAPRRPREDLRPKRWVASEHSGW